MPIALTDLAMSFGPFRTTAFCPRTSKRAARPIRALCLPFVQVNFGAATIWFYPPLQILLVTS